MTRRTKQYFLICFLCFMLSLVIGLVVKFSFHGYRDFQSMETKENLSKYQLQIMETNNESVFLKTKNLKKIKKQSDEFLRVKVLKERKLYRDVTRTKVKIEKAYKSFDHRKEKETIWIDEPAAFMKSYGEIYDSVEGYQLMNDGEEYDVFLNSEKVIRGYKKSENEKRSYLPSTTKYSIYPVKNRKQKEILSQKKLDNGEYSYGKIKNYYILTTRLEELKQYMENKKELKQVYR